MKKYWYYLFLLLLIAPWIVQYIWFYPHGFLESQYELNLSHFWTSIVNMEPLFWYWQFGYGGYLWISYFILIELGGTLFGKTYGIIHIALLISLGFYGMYTIIYNYFSSDVPQNQRAGVSSLVSFIYLSSPTIFYYIKSTIGLTAPAILFPFQLFLLFSIIDGKRKYLFSVLLCLSFIFIAHANITTILLNILFLVLITSIYFKKEYMKIFLISFFSSLPTLLLIVFVILISMKFSYVPEWWVLEALKEDFYSNQTSILQIFKQTADWGFFLSSSSGLYYEFSVFYKKYFINAVGALFWMGLLLFSVFWKNKKIRLYLPLLLVVIALMLGNKFYIYDYLYHNFTPFQIFRNIQKFAPFFLFLLLILSICSYSKRKGIFFFLMFLGVVYNIPYFIYSNYFIRERVVSNISIEREKTISFINDKLPKDVKVLLVPAVYINEIYEFKSGKYLVGVMTDYFTNIKWYRLSPLLNWDYFMQKKMESLFITGDSINGKKIDLRKVEGFLNKFNIPYILLTKDVVQNYEMAEEYSQLFQNRNKYSRIYEDGFHVIYKKNDLDPVIFSGEKIVFLKNKFGNYSINMNLPKKDSKLIYFEAFHPGRKLYINWSTTCTLLKKIDHQTRRLGRECSKINTFFQWEELKYLREKPIFDETHHLVNDYANGRTLDADYIKKNFPKDYYKENPDGSIDVNLTLYFSPQSYFYLWLGVSGLTFLWLITWLLVDRRRQKNLV